MDIREHYRSIIDHYKKNVIDATKEKLFGSSDTATSSSDEIQDNLMQMHSGNYVYSLDGYPLGRVNSVNYPELSTAVMLFPISRQQFINQRLDVNEVIYRGRVIHENYLQFINRVHWVYSETGPEAFAYTAHAIQNIEDLWKNAGVYTNSDNMQAMRMGVNLSILQYQANHGEDFNFQHIVEKEPSNPNQAKATTSVIKAMIRGDASQNLIQGNHHAEDVSKGAISWVSVTITSNGTGSQVFESREAWETFANSWKNPASHKEVIFSKNVFVYGKYLGGLEWSTAYQRRTKAWMDAHAALSNTGSESMSKRVRLLMGSHPSY
jgi:hypothetical protein